MVIGNSMIMIFLFSCNLVIPLSGILCPVVECHIGYVEKKNLDLSQKKYSCY